MIATIAWECKVGRKFVGKIVNELSANGRVLCPADNGVLCFWGERRLSFPSQNKRGKLGREIGMEPDGNVATKLPILMGPPSCTP
jgi:hypothetical protein